MGQIFIYRTIQNFGAVVFATFMTSRQLFSIVLSVYSFDHPLHQGGVFGLALVFTALAIKVRQEFLHKKNGGGKGGKAGNNLAIKATGDAIEKAGDSQSIMNNTHNKPGVAAATTISSDQPPSPSISPILTDSPPLSSLSSLPEFPSMTSSPLNVMTNTASNESTSTPSSTVTRTNHHG
jgi:hypothetical protein